MTVFVIFFLNFIVFPFAIAWFFEVIYRNLGQFILLHRKAMLVVSIFFLTWITLAIYLAYQFPGPIGRYDAHSFVPILHSVFITPSLFFLLLIPVWFTLGVSSLWSVEPDALGRLAGLSWLIVLPLLVFVGSYAAGTSF
jgi:hypothetical protein